jgi:large-conductance mechanosensitive channel
MQLKSKYYYMGIINLDENLKNTVFITIIAASLTEVFFSLAQNVIIPLFDFDIDNDNETEIKGLSKKVIIINKRNIYIGKFLYLTVKFLLIVLILYLISKVL